MVAVGRSRDDINKAFGVQDPATSPGRPRFPSPNARRRPVAAAPLGRPILK